MAMNCEQARNLFDAYVDGELSPPLEMEVSAHRLACASCRQELALLEVVGHVMSLDHEDAEPDLLRPDFTDRLLTCIEPPGTAAARRRSRWLRAGGGVLAIAASMAFAMSLFFNSSAPRVAGVKATRVAPPPAVGTAEVTDAADSLVRQVESNWSRHADGAQTVIQMGEMTLQNVLDRLGSKDQPIGADPVEPRDSRSFDELRPDPADDAIEDL